MPTNTRISVGSARIPSTTARDRADAPVGAAGIEAREGDDQKRNPV